MTDHQPAAAAGAASSPRAAVTGSDEYECELLLTTATTAKEQSQSKTTQPPRRRGSFLEDFNLEDFEGLDDDDDQYVDIEQDAHPPASSSSSSAFDLSSPPRQIRRIAAEAAVDDRPTDTYASSTKNDVSSSRRQSAGSYHLPSHRCHSLMNLNDVPTADNNSNGGRLPRRISFECHSSALFEGMVAGGEFADVFHSDGSASSSDTCSDASSVSSGSSSSSGMPQQQQQRCRRPSSSSPALARVAGAAATSTNNGSIRRTASIIGLRSSSSMISLASICEDANVREAPSLISKVDRYIVNREIRLGSGIVRTQSELAMAALAARQNGQQQMGPGPEGIVADASTVSTTFTRRGRRRSNRSYASTNDLPSASIAA